MFQPHEDTLQVRLVLEDIDTAQTAGVQFARTLAGAPAVAFMLALGEQERLVRTAVEDAGFSELIARSAANAFEVGARLEWERIVPATVQGAMSRA